MTRNGAVGFNLLVAITLMVFLSGLVMWVIMLVSNKHLPQVAKVAEATMVPVVISTAMSVHQPEPVETWPWPEEESLDLTTNTNKEGVSETEKDLSKHGLTLKNTFSVSVTK